MNFGSLGSFEFLWQCLSSLEIFDRNAKASWSNFKVDRNPEFRSLKQGYKKRNISSRGSLNWHYPSILYLLWMRRKCHSLRRDLSENWDFFIKFNMSWTYYKSPTKKQKEYERLFTFGMILLSFRFFGTKTSIFPKSLLLHILGCCHSIWTILPTHETWSSPSLGAFLSKIILWLCAQIPEYRHIRSPSKINPTHSGIWNIMWMLDI